MFGGTAKTYSTWKQDGTPFTCGGLLYINVIHPTTGAIKRVRWYQDKAHADLMPNSNKKPPWEVFGFKNSQSAIQVLRKSDITPEQEAEYFHYNWKRGYKWASNSYFGGCWYAPLGAPSPLKTDKIAEVTWPEWQVAAAQSSSLGSFDVK